MTQLGSTTVRIKLDLEGIRRDVKRTVREGEKANRQLAQLEDNLEQLRADLAEHGIRLEVEK